MPERPLFSIAGIPVRVEPVFFVIMALFGYQLAATDIRLLLIWVAVAFVSILIHELGHGLTLKAFGSPSEITLQGFGGVTVSRRRLARPQSVVVSLAGSVSALVLLWLPARHLDGSTWMYGKSIWIQNAVHFAAFVNLWWSVANLLPIRPLDGGNVVTQLVGVPAARWVSLVVASAAGLWALTHDQQYAGFFALLLGFQSYQEIAAEKGPSRPLR